MRPTNLSLPLSLALTLTLTIATGLAGCANVGGDDSDALDNDPPLSSIDDLFDGTPKNDDVARELGKFDDLLPARSTELRELMSPVKSQASRGVCSIFSTAGLMEHLYIAEGTIKNLDVSEQYLQWSAKFEVGSFPSTSGSNANVNLEAISRFGIVAEESWPYEGTQWGTFDNPDCDGEDDQPTLCYTNGHPTDEIKNAEKFFLPSGRFLNTRDIKGHMQTTGTGVVVGLTFFYQSWNHRKSELPVNSTNWNNGIVLYPNAKDRELSLAKRAGHSILLMGWDDEMEVETRDENGDVVLDSNGEPVMEKGFYAFKNSWGTTGFGINNELGAGYGWISMRYVNEQGRARIAGLPRVTRPDEICDDNKDNDFDGDVDCDDDNCAANPVCSTGGREVSATGPSVEIPDNDSAGVSSVITILPESAGTISELSVTIDVTHTFIGDLRVTLERDGTEVVLHNRAGGGTDDLAATFSVTDFTGTNIIGDWALHISDNARIDVGTLNSWTLTGLVD